MIEFKKLVEQASYIAIVVHKNPDIDSYGCASALYSYMLQLQKKVVLVSFSKELSQKFHVIPWIDKVKNTLPKKVDLIITCGCVSSDKTGFMFELQVINIDHHIKNKKYGDLNILDPKAISTTQVLFDLFKKLEVKINQKMATALYAGLLDKSEAFLSDKVDGTTFAFAKELIKYGAKHKNVVKYLQKYSTLSKLRLLGKMFSQMELLFDAKVALFIVDLELLDATGASIEDCEEALQKALDLPTVDLSILLVQHKDLHITVSLRSIETDLKEIMESYNARGDEKRCEIDFCSILSLDKVKEEILIKVKEIEKKK